MTGEEFIEIMELKEKKKDEETCRKRERLREKSRRKGGEARMNKQKNGGTKDIKVARKGAKKIYNPFLYQDPKFPILLFTHTSLKAVLTKKWTEEEWVIAERLSVRRIILQHRRSNLS